MSLDIRAKSLAARHGLVIAAVLVLVGALAFGGAFLVYTNPPTETVTERVDQQQFGTTADTSAVVTGESPLYERGERLRDRPVYFINATPRLTLVTNTSVPPDASAAVTQRLVLEQEATRGGEPFWASRQVLSATDRRVDDGRLTTRTAVNMSAVVDRVAEKREAIGGIGTFTTRVRLTTTYETETYSGELETTAPVVVTRRAYWLDGSLAANRTESRTVRRQVEGSPDTGTAAGLAGAGLLAVLLAGATGLVYVRDPDLDAMETELARTRYDEWISRGEIPTKAEKQYIRIDTLEDLVDIAIDSGKRVIYDEGYDAYGVVDADIVYYYTPGENDFADWLGV
ncbi:DUF5305 family protein [Haloglomus litoreum]|uniref:DUF5305 family protein n=1 Tax=Haloglomus litoreum TaxID=3034026 RepID=UPI0023E79C96|nr:DUF5305 family protein [Haloglomus sp. DT116]